MSKQVDVNVKCPECKSDFKTKLYRTIWIENPENRKLIFEDEINVVICPHCAAKTKLNFPFLCTNVPKKIAVWYEPYSDPQIDKDIEQYKIHFGPNSYYAKAPRIKEWDSFKSKIEELESKAPGDEANVEMSDEMKANFKGFINHIQKKNGMSREKMKKILSGEAVPDIDELLDMDKKAKDARDIHELLTSRPPFNTFWLFDSIKDRWSESRTLRLWCFGSVCWIIGTFIYGTINNWWWSEEELLLMFSPPIFVGIAKFIYDKFIK